PGPAPRDGGGADRMTSPRVGQPMRPVAAAAPSRPTSDLARIGGRGPAAPPPSRPPSAPPAIGGRARTEARPGPGPIADRLVRQLELTLDRRVGGQMSGDHLCRGHGQGLALDRIRPYEPGDDVRRIDWNATARSLVPQ